MNLFEDYYDEACNYCMVCGFDYDIDKLIICDICNYNVCHTYCDRLSDIPLNDWLCLVCRKSNI